MAGIDASGFVGKDYETIKAEIEAAEKVAFGASINLLADSSFGQLNAIMSERFAELWQVANAVYGSQYPDTADGVSLDEVAAITGAIRLAATRSTVDAVAVGTNGTILTAGRTVSTASGISFVSSSNVTIVTLSAWVTATVYAVGDLRANGGNIYYCIAAGTSAAGPSGTGLDITDGTAHWRYIAAGSAAVVVPFEGSDFGPLVAASGTLTIIETAVAGWASVVNPFDAVPGRNIESDADFRQRREDILSSQGNATIDAIRADVLRVSGVTACNVFENTTLVTDVDGVPGKAIEVLVAGGVDQDIREAIWDSKAAGIETFGTTLGTVVDSQGFTQPVEFSRPTIIQIWVRFDITIDPLAFPVDGVAQIKAATVALGDALPMGGDVIYARMSCLPFDVAGVLDVPVTRTDTVNPPLGVINIPIASRQKADFDTSRVIVNIV